MKDNEFPLTEEEKKIMFSLYMDDINSDDREVAIERFYKVINNENALHRELREQANKIINTYRKYREYEYKKLRKEI